jgi:hypothetical protein
MQVQDDHDHDHDHVLRFFSRGGRLLLALSAMACGLPSPTLMPHLHTRNSCANAGVKIPSIGQVLTTFASALKKF